MAVIKRGVGFTATEKSLASLGDKIFLNLWTYPNIFKKDGKELCDLLVVCGDDVLIFSDKNIVWPENDDFNLSWSRWYRRAIEESVAQINGAVRYLREHSNELFLDATRKEKFPLVLPAVARGGVHCIAVALGAAQSCAMHYKSTAGYFPIDPELRGEEHTSAKAEGVRPFSIGDVQPDGAFVHVFNEPALELLARELDTVTDFTRYLTRREMIIRSGHLGRVAGEHELLAGYLLSGSPDEEHDFRPADGREWREGEKLEIVSGTYAALSQHVAYKARKAADKVSYAWDNLLNQFTTSVLEGEAHGATGQDSHPAEAENGLRSMAREPRLRRRLLGNLVVDAMRQAEETRTNHFARNMAPGEFSIDETVGYVFLIVAHHGDAPGAAYIEYRKRRVALLQGYCLNMLSDNRMLKRAVGIGIDASSKVTGRPGGSEDFYAIEVSEWTPELHGLANSLKQELGLLQLGNVTHGVAAVDEFPHVDELTLEAVTVKPDPAWPKMYRIHFSNGRVSDMTNLTRANDAARSFRTKNGKP